MATLIRVASVDEIPPGKGKEVVAGDQVVAVFNVDGRFFAMDGVCPHAGGPLAEGEVAGTEVTCPWHGWQFDLATGRNCVNSRITHPTFPVTVQGNDVLIEVP